MTDQPRKIPVQYEFSWESREGSAEYDPETGVLTMQIHRDGAVHNLLSRTSSTDEIRALSFAWTPKQFTIPAPEQPNVAGALAVAAECARYDGDHHKQWVFDQMVRNLTGCPLVDMVNTHTASGEPHHYKGLGESDAYREFRAANPHWTEGIAP